MELIDRMEPSDEIKEALCYLCKGDSSDWPQGYKDGLEAALEVIQKTSTVDAVPVVHGRWIERPTLKHTYNCSNCGAIETYTPNYCHNCGAKMDGGAEDG